MKKEKIINFFPNGSTAVFINNKQMPELQKSWCALFAEFLRKKGHDPSSFKIIFSHGYYGRFIETQKNVWNWEFTS